MCESDREKTPHYPTFMTRAAIYSRVSTSTQHIEPQRAELRAYCERRGFDIALDLHDIDSGTAKRSGLDRLKTAIYGREIDVLVVSRFDRLARSTRELLLLVDLCHELGVAFVSVSEQIDTTTMTGRIVYTVLAAVAEFERSLIVERVKVGLDHARARGEQIGRPAIPRDARAEIRKLARSGWSIRKIATKLGIGKSTVARYAKGIGLVSSARSTRTRVKPRSSKRLR